MDVSFVASADSTLDDSHVNPVVEINANYAASNAFWFY